MSEAQPTRIGDYEIEALLGAGGMARVYKARHAFLDTDHAIKVLDPSYRANPDARQRFLDEAKIQAKHLDHPNIVKVTNIVSTPEHAALVMELIDGTSLEAKIHELRERPDEIRRIMYAVLDGVGHAHKAGIIHRDLKPANVLLANKHGQVIPKVTDFGIAKVSAEVAGAGKKSTHGDMRMGTLLYMSPEQIRRAKDVTPRSDVFALGAMLYEMATGVVAFGGESDYDVMENIVNGRYEPPERRYAGIDRGLAHVIRTALDPDPMKRYASCADMAAALRGEAERPVPVPDRVPDPLSAPPSPSAPAVARRSGGVATSTLPDGVVNRPTGAGTAQRPVVSQTNADAPTPTPTPTTTTTARPAPAAPRSSAGLVIALVVGGVALGGVALFLTMRGDDPAASSAPPADAARIAAAADASAAAAPPDATAVAVVSVDAGAIATATVDAAVVDATPVDDPEVIADTRKIDAGSRKKASDAGARAAAPIDAGTGTATGTATASAPHPCVGLWAGAGVIITIRKESGTCGKIDFVERQGGKQSICSGVLRGCSSSSSSIGASFDCNWSEKQTTGLTASFTFECTPDAMVADVSFTHPTARHDRWRFSR